MTKHNYNSANYHTSIKCLWSIFMDQLRFPKGEYVVITSLNVGDKLFFLSKRKLIEFEKLFGKFNNELKEAKDIVVWIVCNGKLIHHVHVLH